MTDQSKWEFYDSANNAITERLKVDGGWLYHLALQNTPSAANMCFVPDVDLARYQSHLRDAFKQGYEAGHKDAGSGVHESFEL